MNPGTPTAEPIALSHSVLTAFSGTATLLLCAGTFQVTRLRRWEQASGASRELGALTT